MSICLANAADAAILVEAIVAVPLALTALSLCSHHTLVSLAGCLVLSLAFALAGAGRCGQRGHAIVIVDLKAGIHV